MPNARPPVQALTERVEAQQQVIEHLLLVLDLLIPNFTTERFAKGLEMAREKRRLADPAEWDEQREERIRIITDDLLPVRHQTEHRFQPVLVRSAPNEPN